MWLTKCYSCIMNIMQEHEQVITESFLNRQGTTSRGSTVCLTEKQSGTCPSQGCSERKFRHKRETS